MSDPNWDDYVKVGLNPELRKPGKSPSLEPVEPGSGEGGMQKAGEASIWEAGSPARGKPGKQKKEKVVKTGSREAGKRQSAKAGVTPSREAVKKQTRKPGKTVSSEAGKRIAVKQKIGRRETIQWLGGGAQITVGTKAPEDVASYWASQAKLKRLSMSFVINMAMIEAYGLPDGGVLEEAD